MKTTNQARSRRTVATGRCVLVGIRAIIFFSLSIWPLRAETRDKQFMFKSDVDEHCIDNLRRIYELVHAYLHQSGSVAGFPSDLEVIALMANDPKLLICPADKLIKNSDPNRSLRTNYEIVNDPLTPKLSKLGRGRIAIVAEKRPNHHGRRFVLFYDGSVKAFNISQFETLRKNSFITVTGPGASLQNRGPKN